MSNQVFVIVDVKKRLYFAKNQPGHFATSYENASKWTSEAKGKKALKKIINKPAIKAKTEQLVVKELKLAAKELQTSKEPIKQPPKEPIEETPEKSIKQPPKEPIKQPPDEPTKEVNLPDYEDFLDQLEKLCMLMINANQIKHQLEKKISESDGKDLDFLHVLELGKFDAAQGSQLIKWEKESRRQRRQYKDEWWAIDTLFPAVNDGLVENAEKCLEVLKTIKENKRLYRFRNKETEEKFGKLLPQNSEATQNDSEKFREIEYDERFKALMDALERG